MAHEITGRQVRPSDEVRRAIRALMAYRGVTQAELAQGIGLSQPALSGRLDGSRRLLFNEVEDIARFFGLSIGALYEAVPALLGGDSTVGSVTHRYHDAPGQAA